MPDATTQPNPWSDHEGYDLIRWTLTSENISDRDDQYPGMVRANVRCLQFKGANTAGVDLMLRSNSMDARSRMSPDNARTLANALLAAADIVDAFEVDECLREEAELARINAGPINRIELPGGVVAFEPVTEGGAA